MNRELIKRLSGHLADIIHCHRSSIRIENGITGISPLREISLKLLIGRGMPRQLFRRVHGLVCSTRRIILKTVRPPANSMPVTTIRAITSAASIMTRTITSMTSTVSRMTGIALGIMAYAILGTASIVRRMSIAVTSVTSAALGTTGTAISMGRAILGMTSLISPSGTVLPARTVLGAARTVSGMTSTVPGMVRTVSLTGTIGMPIASLGTPRVILRAASIVRLTGTIGMPIAGLGTTSTALGTTSTVRLTGTLGTTGTAISMGRTILGMTSTAPGMVRTVSLTGTVTSSTVVCATGATINVTGVISSRRTRIRRGLRRRYLCRRRRPGGTFASVHMRFRNTRIRDVTRSVRGMRRRRNLDLDIDVRSRPLGDEVRRVNVEIGYLQDLRRELAGWDAYNRSNGIRIGQNLIRDLQTSADLRGGRPRLAELPNL